MIDDFIRRNLSPERTFDSTEVEDLVRRAYALGQGVLIEKTPEEAAQEAVRRSLDQFRRMTRRVGI